MRPAALVVLVLAAACAKKVRIGETCAQTAECGNGADCYHGVCTPLCADDGECDGELVCARHHCLLATGEPRRGGSSTAADERPSMTDAPSPIPDRRAPLADSQTPVAPGRLPTSDERLPPNDDRRRRPGLRSSASSYEALDPAALMAELRAIRAEIESLRREQERLNQAITDLKSPR